MRIIHKKIIGSIHLILSIIGTFYGLVTQKNYFDKIYLIVIMVILLLWIYCDGHCYLSYKLNENKNIIDHHEDMYIIFNNKYNNEINNYIFSTIFITTISLYIVLLRNNYSNLFSLFLCYIYISYRLILKIKNKKIIKLYTNFSKIASIGLLLLILNKEKIINLNIIKI